MWTTAANTLNYQQWMGVDSEQRFKGGRLQDVGPNERSVGLLTNT